MRTYGWVLTFQKMPEQACDGHSQPQTARSQSEVFLIERAAFDPPGMSTGAPTILAPQQQQLRGMGIHGLWPVRSDLFVFQCLHSNRCTQYLQAASEPISFRHFVIQQGFTDNINGTRKYRIGIDARYGLVKSVLIASLPRLQRMAPCCHLPTFAIH
jgi:hypothetical protein